MNEKVVVLEKYRKKRNNLKKEESEKNYEEIVSEQYAEELVNEFKELMKETSNKNK